MTTVKKIEMTPIGFVKIKMRGRVGKWRQTVSELILRKELVDALAGIEAFSHVFVLFWMHELSEGERKLLKVHPRRRHSLPLQGVFATRTPHRPNAIGLTVVKLLNVEGNVLTVQGLDAFDGSPIIDIKPFDFWDTPEDVKLPSWWMMLEKERQHEP